MSINNMEKPPLACTVCAKAKARCIWSRSDSVVCERCERLGKTCRSRDRAPPRVKQRPKRSRVAELEKRLSELSSQVVEAKSRSQQQQQQQQQEEAEVSPGPEAAAIAASKNGPLDFKHLFPDPSGQPEKNKRTAAENSPPKVAAAAAAAATASTGSARASPPFSMLAHHAWETLWPMPDETEQLLCHFQDTYARIFPFVLIPRSTSAAELKESKPFLFKAVMVVACYLDGGRHHRLGEEVLWDMSKAIMMDGDKSLDLLQALMLIIAWFHHALKSTRLTSLLFLARSMCLNLGMGGTQPVPGVADAAAAGTDLDLYRAYCGTYYLNTLVFTCNKRTDVFMNTVYLDTCCRLLEAARQRESDELLVKLVRIQQIAQSISMTMAFEQSQQQAMQLPLTMVVQSFQDQLDAFRTSLPPGLADNPMLTSHIHLAAVLLTEVALSDQHCGPARMPPTDRLRLLYACVRSLRSFFETRFNPQIFNVEFPRFLCLHGSDLTYGVLMSVRLVTLRLVPGWTMAKVGGELSIRWIMERLCFHISCLVDKRRKGVWGKTGVREGEDPFERVLDTCQRARAQVVLEMERAEEGEAETAVPAAAEATADDGGVQQQYRLDEEMVGFGDELMSEDVWAGFLEEAGWSMNTDLGLLEPV